MTFLWQLKNLLPITVFFFFFVLKWDVSYTGIVKKGRISQLLKTPALEKRTNESCST